MVWVKRWAFDTRAEIDGAGMIDTRVTHLWDGELAASAAALLR